MVYALNFFTCSLLYQQQRKWETKINHPFFGSMLITEIIFFFNSLFAVLGQKVKNKIGPASGRREIMC